MWIRKTNMNTTKHPTLFDEQPMLEDLRGDQIQRECPGWACENRRNGERQNLRKGEKKDGTDVIYLKSNFFLCYMIYRNREYKWKQRQDLGKGPRKASQRDAVQITQTGWFQRAIHWRNGMDAHQNANHCSWKTILQAEHFDGGVQVEEGGQEHTRLALPNLLLLTGSQ